MIKKQNLKSGKVNIKNQIYSIIKEKIINREFAPNEPLDANQIAQSLGVSRTPVRDALIMLGSDGFVNTIPRKGTFVAGLYEKDIRELYAARKMVELFVLEYNFPSLKKNVDQLKNIVVKNKEKTDQQLAVADEFNGSASEIEKPSAEINLEFHNCIVYSSNNCMIINYYDNVTSLLSASQALYNYFPDKNKVDNAQQDHENLIKFIEEEDTDGAKKLLLNHIDYTMNQVLKTVQMLVRSRILRIEKDS
jgi:DNA-binding GntR family transcriptional regulator